jgi:hypothetical protein
MLKTRELGDLGLGLAHLELGVVLLDLGLDLAELLVGVLDLLEAVVVRGLVHGELFLVLLASAFFAFSISSANLAAVARSPALR